MNLPLSICAQSFGLMTFGLIRNVFTQIGHRLDGIIFDMELSGRQVRANLMPKKIKCYLQY